MIKNKGADGKLVKTVGASRMLDIVAQQYDIDVVETPVGFKWVGAAMREYDTIIGGEESGGLSIKGHIPEKDGLLANSLILEAMAYENKSLKQLQHTSARLRATRRSLLSCLLLMILDPGILNSVYLTLAYFTG